MHRARLSVAGAAGLALFSLCLGEGARAQCSNDCGTGTLAEGENCVVSNLDRINDGCAVATPAFLTISGPEVVCGSSSTIDVEASRDTDWIRVPQSALSAADADGNGVVQVRALLSSEFPGVVVIVALGDPLCEGEVVVGSTGFSAAGCAGGEDAKATLVIADHPNGVAVFVSTGNADGSGIFEGYPCSGGANDYTVSITLPDSPAVCAPGAGPCNEAHASPGCDDVDCCKIVCEEIDDFCCLFDWDEVCVELAVASGCTPAAIQCPAGGGLEITHSASTDVVPFNSIACSNQQGTLTTANAFARAYDLAAIAPGEDVTINCVAWGIEVNTMGIEVPDAAVNVYRDDTGGTPVGDAPGAGLTLLGAVSPFVIPADANETILTAQFAPPLTIPADTLIVVELDIPDTFTFTGIWPGSNSGGNLPPPPTGNYIRSEPCGAPAYMDIAAPPIGVAGMHLVNVVIADSAPPCPWDTAGPGGGGPDGVVGINDLLTLLSHWGPCP